MTDKTDNAPEEDYFALENRAAENDAEAFERGIEVAIDRRAAASTSAAQYAATVLPEPLRPQRMRGRRSSTAKRIASFSPGEGW